MCEMNNEESNLQSRVLEGGRRHRDEALRVCQVERMTAAKEKIIIIMELKNNYM